MHHAEFSKTFSFPIKSLEKAKKIKMATILMCVFVSTCRQPESFLQSSHSSNNCNTAYNGNRTC